MSNYNFKVKAIIDSVDLQEQIKKIKIDPIKIQVDLGGIGNSNSGTSQAAGIAASFDQAGVAADKFRGKNCRYVYYRRRWNEKTSISNAKRSKWLRQPDSNIIRSR